MTELALLVPYRGQPTMVGKIVEIRGTEVFVHEETSGDQHLRLYNSPGGVDVRVVNKLEALGVRWIAHVKGRVMLLTETSVMRAKGVEDTLDGRHRVFLPRQFWTRYQAPTFFKYIREELVLDDE